MTSLTRKMSLRGFVHETAQQVAAWCDADGFAASGTVPSRAVFNVMPAFLLGSPADFVDMAIPELQRRGLFQTEYEGTTLRDHLGLPTPVSRWQNVPMVTQ
jgi:hypothetical protein